MADDPPRPDAPPPSADPAPPRTDADPKPDPAADPKDSEVVDMTTFNQILELDDDDEHEFSKEMVWAFFAQAETTFEEMHTALAEKDLTKLSHLGHFLKGSASALGIHKVQATCEKMQHYGELRDEEAHEDLTPKDALERIKVLIVDGKTEYEEAERWLKKWYKVDGAEENEKKKEEEEKKP